MGDPTARVAGRVTLNPVAHLEPLGLIMILFAPIGWAKPVPVNGANFRHPRRAMLLVAAAGPVSNLILAAVCGGLMHVVPRPMVDEISWNDFLTQLLWWGFIVNVSLFVFNLIPIPPLDGSRIVASLLPPRLEYRYSRLELYGPFILFLLVLIPPLRNQVFLPLFSTALNWVASWLALAPWMV
ncbi:MAG: site-2 protease family protein [Alicyclobacillus sp.]|nr:site-2 protease family protein [Alicyclobacillus sp.]